MSDDGTYTVNVVARIGMNRAVLCPVSLLGPKQLRPFANIKSGLYGDERIFVEPSQGGGEKNFFTDLDLAVEGKPIFSLSHLVDEEERLDLFAVMLLYARASDIEFLGKLHPAEIARYAMPHRAQDKPVVEAYDPDDKDHRECKREMELHISSKWACFAGRVLSNTSEPFYTVIAPENANGLVEITTNTEQSFMGTPFGTFPANKRERLDVFANLMVEIGCASGVHTGCDIELLAPEFVTPRHHGTEIAYSAWAISGNYERTTDPDIKKLNDDTSEAGGFFPHWSNGTLWVDPYRPWKDRECWEERWRAVDQKVGKVTIESLNSCKSEEARARLRLKPIIDFLMQA